MQLSVAVRNAILEAIETTIGVSPLLRFYSGSIPADCATAAAGTKIAEGALPSDWAANASAGSKTKSGTWTVTGVTAAGGGTVADYYRIYDSTGTTCHEQGTIGTTGGGQDLLMDNQSVANTQTVTVNAFTHNALNA